MVRSVSRSMLVLVMCLCSVPALAQAVPGAQEYHQVRVAGAHEARLSNEWTIRDGGRRGRVVLRVAPRAPVVVHEGAPVLTDMAVGHDAVLVAMVHSGRRPFVKLALIGLTGDAEPRLLEVPRRDSSFSPTAIVACRDPQGFSVLWQEQGATRSASQSFLARVSPGGGWLQTPAPAPVHWAIAAISHNGEGYHLALYFDGSAPDQTRLSMVTLSADGRPQQHPDWASAPHNIDSVQLVRHGGRVHAYLRTGADADGLISHDVTTIRGWGTDPGPPRTQQSLDPDEEWAVAASADGPAVVRRPLDAFP